MLRLARLGDLDALVRIEKTCFPRGQFRRDHLEWIIRNERGLTLVEETARGLEGALMLLLESRVCRVLSVAVMPSARRRGLATTMLAAAEDAARRRGAVRIRLEVSTRNAAAIELYRSLGYEMEGVLPRYYSWGEDAFSMSKPLSPALRRASPPPPTVQHLS
ncbi:MAG TPA: GNAT family N-acetyltransferase [Thermoplasmata archaeon]|nr:GNAT family N-acetyltransferase [Thermoplasmata archaeon]